MANVKADLQAELAKDSPDPSIVARLTDELLDQSTNSVRFTVDAGHINRLGYELVGKQETALSELIKNAYDADATGVEIRFQNYDRPGGTLIIADTGTGMSADTIRNTWMRLSTRDKIDHPKSPIFDRPRAGRKGIGRFAVQRLGQKLTLETSQIGQAKGIRVKFDWDASYRSGMDLGHVWNDITTFDKAPDSQGTKLIIEDLRDSWRDEYFERVWRSVLFLQPPFPLGGAADHASGLTNASIKDPGFEVTINGLQDGKRKARFDLQNSFLNLALAEITGSIDSNGRGKARIISKRLGFDETVEFEEHYDKVGVVYLESRYFIYHTDFLSGISQKTAAAMGTQYGGVRVYRNGFRVAPYGEPSDDWLRLSDRQARRVLLAAMNNNNFFGHVTLSAKDNPNLEETSSREGLVENDAYKELVNFTFECLYAAVKLVAERRQKKVQASQTTGYTPARKASAEAALESLAAAQEKIEEAATQTGPERDAALAEAVAQVSLAVKIQEGVVSDENNYLEYENMLRILASLGASMSIFGHEIKAMNNSVNGQITLLQAGIGSLRDQLERDALLSRIELLRTAVGRVFNLGGYIENLTSYTQSRVLKKVHVLHSIESFFEQFRTYLLRNEIKVKIEVQPRDLRTIEMHASELEAALFNFTTNAVKALRKHNSPGNHLIKVSAKEDGNFVLINFEDNGPGIHDSIRDRIFDAFFTTTQGRVDDFSGAGTGLGLRIVSDIASAYGGSVELTTPSDGYSTNFAFRILRG
ncbi:sensor histidine kinase [Asticcacaulis sp. EMRT-3]|uniref:sensor histidine kinase n=1 Tax=Asticcacaulis sp. EMRT-3 TaxID=3040349 RepID=UPI0024AF53A3|nr:sensor histidine kinase [Asticcacaulis sp. EMRT-3]MDI7774038.1 sensor histidine kinase [Asticcacaulis sp. EMRT-3]